MNFTEYYNTVNRILKQMGELTVVPHMVEWYWIQEVPAAEAAALICETDE